MELAKRVFSCIDNTTLNATDSEASVEAFCRRTREMTLADGTHVAAVCVYPRFVTLAKQVLDGSGIRVATVAGAFPHGQATTAIKVAEVEGAVKDGADEVDIVIGRGDLLSGDYRRALNELQLMRKHCKGALLKVILETVELPTDKLIRDATLIAIAAGADFVKTSTGKAAVGATPKAAATMLKVVKKNVNFNKKSVGFKAAGGIRTPEEALAYAELAKKVMGDEYINSQTFRIGASRLTEGLFSLLTF